MKKRYLQIFIFLSFAILCLSTKGVAQKTEKEDYITIKSVLKDEQGNPIKGAMVYGNEGTIVVKTDASGNFIISIPDKTDLLIESDGYESVVFKEDEIKNRKEFLLKSSLSQYGEKDVLNIAFRKVKRGDLVNAVSVIDPSEILKYDNIQDITEALSGRVPGLYSSYNIRGIGNPLFIVDGLPRDISTINLTEVAQISVLKDINSSIMYGNEAVNGVVIITTKRGQAHKNEVNVSGFYGLSAPTALPKYLSSADYMQLFNEARVNDGLPEQYDAETISNYRSGNSFRYPSVDYYSKDKVNNVKLYSKVLTELSGGNDIATYYSSIGWDQSGSLLHFGEWEKAKQNKFSIRGNVDLKINHWIKSSLDAVAVFDNATGPGGSYWWEASIMQPNLFSPLIPISLIDPNNALLNTRKNDVDGKYLLGGTTSYLGNQIANGYSGGTNEDNKRTVSFNNRVDFDLKQLVEGLSFHTNLSFDLYSEYNQRTDITYSVYEPTWNENDSIGSLVKYGSDTRSGSQNIGDSFLERRVGFYGLLDYDRTYGNVHHISGSLLGYGNTYKIQGDYQGNKNVNLGLRLGYIYNNTYMLDFSSAYVNSPKLPSANRRAFSPSLGLAWVISSENFMSSLTEINYLKLKASGGIVNSDAGIPGFYYYDNMYDRSGGYSWDEGNWSTSGTVSSFGGNNGLYFEKRKELNLGLEAVLFNRKLSVEANVFKNLYYDQITRPATNYPSFYTNYIPYENFDSNSYRGVELGLSYKQSFGDFSFLIGGNALYSNSEVKKKDEIYVDQYQYRKGRPVDARFGLVADGFFMDQADIDSHEIQAFGNVKPGDIKYIDQNSDGVIDDNDEVQIGRWQAPFSYGLNLKLAYKNFTFFVKGNGRIGADGYLSDSYYRGDGNSKYSEYILNRWTEETKTTANTPRLSSLSNINNYRSSTFWLYKDNYFTVDRVQLTYEMPEKISRALKMKSLIFHVDASNLLTISKFKSNRELRVGGEPYYRSFSLGVKTMF